MGRRRLASLGAPRAYPALTSRSFGSGLSAAFIGIVSRVLA